LTLFSQLLKVQNSVPFIDILNGRKIKRVER